MCRVSDDYVDLLTQRDALARKSHRCDECRRTIAVGELYRYESWVWEGDFAQGHTCAHCLNVRRWLMAACNGWVYGELESDLLDHVTGDERELRTRPLTRLARWMAADWLNRAGDLRPLDDVTAVADEAIAAYKTMYATAVNA